MKPDLASIPFLQGADPMALRAAAEAASWFSVPAGVALFEAGEDSTCLYFLMSGSMAAFRSGPDGSPGLLGYIRPGEPVGEMALIAGEPHSADVYAIRDCELLRLEREDFDNLVRAHPSLMSQMARLMLQRARMQPRTNPRAEPKVYALFSTSPTIDLVVRARALKDGLAAIGKRATIVGEEAVERSSMWFDTLERENDIVLLVAPIGDSNWFRMCMRQADRIWVLARADAKPAVPLLPEEAADSPAKRFRLVDVVLLHYGMDRKAAPTEVWRDAVDAARVFHWRNLDSPDCARLARVMAGQAIGLVLSGGGARAYAHIGVIRAMREAGVPFDIVGGTSMGAIVAACYAMGWDDNEIEDRIRRAFVESNPLGDYVLPVVALTRGKRVESRLQEHFGDTLIEDLTVPFFCCSTDVCGGGVRVHRSGSLRFALRATISLPGILPPVVDPDGGLLVDGAVLQNFPVDVLQGLHRGPIVGVDVARRSGLSVDDFKDPPGFFSWVAAHGMQNAPPIASLLMRAATLAIDPWQGRAQTDMLITPDMPDVDLRDWKEFDEAVASGYEAAVTAIRERPDILAKARPQPSAPALPHAQVQAAD
jgi:NTE family protein